MKVYIGPYSNGFRAYKLARILLFWKDAESDTVEKFTEFLRKFKIIKWLEKKSDEKERKIKVEVHDYDIWSLDSTLAEIIYPALKLYRSKLNSYHTIDEWDIPTNYTGNRSDANEVWLFIIDEMIWAFEQYVNGNIFEYDDSDRYIRLENGLRLFGKYYTALWD